MYGEEGVLVEKNSKEYRIEHKNTDDIVIIHGNNIAPGSATSRSRA